MKHDAQPGFMWYRHDLDPVEKLVFYLGSHY